MPCCNTAPYKRLRSVLLRQCSYTAHATKQRTWLYRGVSCDCSHSAANDTKQTQAAIIPPAPSWSVSQRRRISSAYQIPAPRPDAAQVSTAAYYKWYIRVRPPVMAPCQTVQHIEDHASPVGSSPTVCGSLASAAPCASADVSAYPPVQGQPGGVSMLPMPGGLRSGTVSTVDQSVGGHPGTLHPAGQSSGRDAADGAEPLTAAAVSLFGLSPDS